MEFVDPNITKIYTIQCHNKKIIIKNNVFFLSVRGFFRSVTYMAFPSTIVDFPEKD
jgi:hypothetical protein